MNAKPHLTQNEKLDRLLSDHEGEWVPLPDVLALGIAAYSRRFEDLRKLYGPQGYAIENRCERGHDGIVRSWYRKIRAGYPQAERAEHPHQSPQIHKARRSAGAWKSQSIFSAKTKSWEQVCAERDKSLAESQSVPDLVLTP